MTILCIETSTSVCSAAICKDGVPVKQMTNREGSNHARLLPLYIEQWLSFAREQGLVIEAVALSEGPGSYTGLRIGTSTAKGLCYGLNVPLIPVPTLEVLCEAARANTEYGVQSIDLLCPMIDARRMEVYTLSELKAEGSKLKDKTSGARAVVVENEESLTGGAEISSDGLRNIYYFGDGAEKCRKVLTQPNWHYIPDVVPEAQYVGVLAEQTAKAASQMSNHQSVDLAYYEPYYLKEFVAAQSHVKGLK